MNRCYMMSRHLNRMAWTATLTTLLTLNLYEQGRGSTDLGVVPLFDGKQTELVNTWGGFWSLGGGKPAFSLRLRDLPGSQHGLCIEIHDRKERDICDLQCFSSGFGRTGEYYQTRDLTRYARLRFRVRNTTGAAVAGKLQLKDYRDSTEHSATCPFDLPKGEEWTVVDLPLNTSTAPWTHKGSADLSRVLTLDFILEPGRSVKSGEICMEEVALIEPGSPVDAETSPINVIAERLARRQWDGLWAARNRRHGMIPNNSFQATDAGLNTTAAVLWMLPTATRRHWVERDEADRYVESLVKTIDRLLDRAKYLPPRNVDWVTLEPSLLPEESSIDAAFLALALYQYGALASTPESLRQAVQRTRNRFDFKPFTSAAGWRMAYRYPNRYGPEGFIPCTYDGYTNEGNLISLAAHLSPGHAVSIETYWNSSAHRVRAGLTPSGGAPVVHRLAEFRSPFTQALWNLFVDVRERGVDCYPDDQLAVNPWSNFVCYEQNVLSKLAEAKRPYLVQPDAGDDGSLGCYRQFSVYDHCGRDDLFMPWSAALALQSGAEHSDTALRFLLAHGLSDCFGLADSARWKTGASEAYAISPRHDFWSTSLSTMALLEWLDGPAGSSRTFAALPEVSSALDRVFPKVRHNPAPPTAKSLGSAVAIPTAVIVP